MEDNKQHICKYCKKEFKSGKSLGAHIIHCKDNPNNHINDFANRRTENARKNNPLLHYRLICCICNNEYEIDCFKNNFENGKYKHTCSDKCSKILTYRNTNLEEKNKKISENSSHYCFIKDKHLENNVWVKNSEEYNKSLYISKTQICKYCGKEFTITEKTKKGRLKDIHFCCYECKHNYFSELSKKSNLGGYIPNSIKKHHHGNYHGIHCDSSWELAYLVYNLEHNIPIKRCNIKRTYIIDGKQKNYFPDFIINDNKIVEIKGYYDKSAKIKQEQNPDILILFEKDLKDILKYVSSKYGNKFWETLYE